MSVTRWKPLPLNRNIKIYWYIYWLTICCILPWYPSANVLWIDKWKAEVWSKTWFLLLQNKHRTELSHSRPGNEDQQISQSVISLKIFFVCWIVFIQAEFHLSIIFFLPLQVNKGLVELSLVHPGQVDGSLHGFLAKMKISFSFIYFLLVLHFSLKWYDCPCSPT